MLYYQTVFRVRGKKGNFCTVFRLAADRLEISLEGVGYETAYKEQVKKRRYHHRTEEEERKGRSAYLWISDGKKKYGEIFTG